MEGLLSTGPTRPAYLYLGYLQYFYHGFLPERQSHGHGASCSSRGALTLGEVGFGETMGQCRARPSSVSL